MLRTDAGTLTDDGISRLYQLSMQPWAAAVVPVRVLPATQDWMWSRQLTWLTLRLDLFKVRRWRWIRNCAACTT
jgi:hypothetical protein